MAKEHDPNTCHVCQELGDFAETTDTAEWLDAHRDNGYEFRIDDGKAIELLAPAK